MNNNKIKVIFIAILLLASISYGQDKVKTAQTGMKFLSVTTDAHVTGMGDAMASLEGGAGLLFVNPASVSRQKTFSNFNVGIMEYIADIKYLSAAATFAPFEGQYGVVGFFYNSVDYGDFYETLPDGDSYIEVGTFQPTAFQAGITYAKEISDMFSVGGNIKLVRQDLGSHIVKRVSAGNYVREDFSLDVMAFDFGILYKTGYEDLNLGVVIRNFSEEVQYKKESFQLPLTMKIGLSMNVLTLADMNPADQSLIVSVNATKPRDYKEQLNLGLQYTLFNTIALRFGYITPTDNQGINAGVGLSQNIGGVDLKVDYAYSAWDIFDDVHRVSLNFGL